nr:hypothetical protein GCM10020093_094100 [Planobispora longispora]
MLTLSKQGEDVWQISSLSLLEEPLPEITRDAEGYATALGDDDSTVQISPRLMAPLHATTAEEGSAGFATGLIAEGPHTTAHATEIADKRAEAKANDCRGYESIFAAAGYPVRALRTADGGALIMYSLIRTTTETAEIHPCGLPIGMPEEARGLAPRDDSGEERRAQEELRIVETQQYVSTVPPKSSGKAARVIGYTGGVTKVFVT